MMTQDRRQSIETVEPFGPLTLVVDGRAVT
jgi:hypothetical protein